jgi:hypothetical protein
MLTCGQTVGGHRLRRRRGGRCRLRDGPLRLRVDAARRALGVRPLGAAAGPDRQRHLRRLPRRAGLRGPSLGPTRAAGAHDRRWGLRGGGCGDRRAGPLALAPRSRCGAQRECRRVGVGSLLRHRDQGGAAPPSADAAGGDHDRNQPRAGRSRRARPARHARIVAPDLGGHRRCCSDRRGGEPPRRAPADRSGTRQESLAKVAVAPGHGAAPHLRRALLRRHHRLLHLRERVCPQRRSRCLGGAPALRPHRCRWADRTAHGPDDRRRRHDGGRDRQHLRGQQCARPARARRYVAATDAAVRAAVRDGLHGGLLAAGHLDGAGGPGPPRRRFHSGARRRRGHLDRGTGGDGRAHSRGRAAGDARARRRSRGRRRGRPDRT